MPVNILIKNGWKPEKIEKREKISQNPSKILKFGEKYGTIETEISAAGISSPLSSESAHEYRKSKIVCKSQFDAGRRGDGGRVSPHRFSRREHKYLRPRVREKA